MAWLIETIEFEKGFRKAFSPKKQSHLLHEGTTTNEEVPSLPLLRAFSFSAWAQADNTLRTAAFPNLFHTRDNEPRWKAKSEVSSRFHLEIRKEHFNLTQVKQYLLIKRRYNESQTDDIETILGTMDVCWEIASDWEGDEYFGKLFFRNLSFTLEADFSTINHVLQQMGI